MTSNITAKPHLAIMFALLALLTAPSFNAPVRAVAAAQADPQGAAILQPSSAGRFAAGAKVYAESCAACHDPGINRAPQKFALQDMAPEAIYTVLTKGIMRPQAAALSNQDRIAVAEYLAQATLGTAARSAKLNMCRADRARFNYGEPPVFAGWGLDAANTHAVPGALAGLDRQNVGTLKLKWALALPGSTRVRSQPSLAGGAIFVGSQTGTVYALDRETGCVRWTFNAPAEVRTSIVISPWRAGDARARPMAYFGDALGNMHAVSAVTGKPIWRVAADAHPVARITGTPALFGGVLFVPIASLEEAASANPNYACCTFRGSIVALNAATGTRKWRSWLVDPPVKRGTAADGREQFGPAGVSVWSTPAVDAKRRQLYVVTGNNYTMPVTALSDSVLALDIATGRVKWHYQATKGDAWNVACAFKGMSANCPEDAGPDFDFGAAAVLATIKDGRQLVLAGQKSGITYGLDPDGGKLLWQARLGRGGAAGGVLFGIAAANGLLFAPISDMPDPNAGTYPLSPGLYAVDAATGAVAWRAQASDSCGGKPLCRPGLSGAVTATPQLVLAGADDGHLRVYDAETGKVLWDEDTNIEYRTVNGLPGHGGAIAGGSAPIVYKGDVIVGSGYGFANKMPGNVLLVFSSRQSSR